MEKEHQRKELAHSRQINSSSDMMVNRESDEGRKFWLELRQNDRRRVKARMSTDFISTPEPHQYCDGLILWCFDTPQKI